MEKKIKVLLYSYLFYPDIGGIESISSSLAEGLVQQGHECIVITQTEAILTDNFAYKIYRRPTLAEKIRLVKWADVIAYNGAGLGLQPFPVLFNKPFVWIHQGYQISCIDGLGWVEGEKAPMTPWASINFHYKKSGLIAGFTGALKVFTKFFFAKYLVTRNVACTDWVLNRLPPLKLKRRIYSPYPLKKFEHPSAGVQIQYDFVFVGRLVSEKGILTLLHAFNKLTKKVDANLTLLVIGDGNWRPKAEDMIVENKLDNHVTMVGKKTGQELTDLIHSCKIAVVPSEWEEPMGGVALELLSAGRNIIVSSNGGMAECVGNAGLTFLNGDVNDLFNTMNKLLTDTALQEQQKANAKKQLQNFQLENRVAEHVSLFEEILR